MSVDRSSSDVMWDPVACEASGCDLEAYWQDCEELFGDRVSAFGKTLQDVEHLCLEALVEEKFDTAKALKRAESHIETLEADAWTAQEKRTFRTFMESEQAVGKPSKDQVTSVSLRRCADEFLPHRTLRQCWKLFFEERYHEEMFSTGPFTDLPPKRAARTTKTSTGRRRRKSPRTAAGLPPGTTWACTHCTFINPHSRKKCKMCELPRSKSLQAGKSSSSRPASASTSSSGGSDDGDDKNDAISAVAQFIDLLQTHAEPTHLASFMDVLIRYDAHVITSAQAMKRIKSIASDTGLSAHFVAVGDAEGR